MIIDTTHDTITRKMSKAFQPFQLTLEQEAGIYRQSMQSENSLRHLLDFVPLNMHGQVIDLYYLYQQLREDYKEKFLIEHIVKLLKTVKCVTRRKK